MKYSSCYGSKIIFILLLFSKRITNWQYWFDSFSVFLHNNVSKVFVYFQSSFTSGCGNTRVSGGNMNYFLAECFLLNNCILIFINQPIQKIILPWYDLMFIYIYKFWSRSMVKPSQVEAGGSLLSSLVFLSLSRFWQV